MIITKKAKYLSLLFVGSIIFFIPRVRNNKKKKKKNNKLIGLSFGPTGGLFSYNLGATKYIQEKFNLDNLIFAGVSGGVQSCLLLSLDISIDKGFDNWLKPLVNDIKDNFILNFIPPFNMMDVSKKYLKFFLKNKNFDFSKLNGKFYASITRIFPYPHNYSETNWINSYDDLYDGIKSSQYLPFLSGYPVCLFRNYMCVDGYLTNTRFEPIEGKWIHINPFKWRNKNILHGISSLSKIGDINFQIEEYNLGYEDAKKKHSYFVKNGLIEK